jgi:DNA repair photolyase
VLVAPVVPFLNDSDIESIISLVRQAGAQSAGYVMVRLPHEVRDLFRGWLNSHLPDKAERIMNRIRDMRGGRDNDAAFGRRMTGSGVFAELIRQRFEQAGKRAGFAGLPGFDCDAFRPPPEEDSQSQLSLF